MVRAVQGLRIGMKRTEQKVSLQRRNVKSGYGLSRCSPRSYISRDCGGLNGS